MSSTGTVKRRLEVAFDEADLFPRVVAGWSTRGGVGVVVAHVFLSRAYEEGVMDRVCGVVESVGGVIEGVGLEVVVALFDPRS